jgi:hypothetical protein
MDLVINVMIRYNTESKYFYIDSYKPYYLNNTRITKIIWDSRISQTVDSPPPRGGCAVSLWEGARSLNGCHMYFE